MTCSKNLQNKAFKIKPSSPFLGEIDSIKMYGAMIRADYELFGDGAILSEVRNGCLKISSPMPLVNETKFVFKPDLTLNAEDTVLIKKFKKVRFVPIDLAEESLKVGKFTKELGREAVNKGGNFIAVEEAPGVSVGRLGNESNIYYKDTVVFVHNKNGKSEEVSLWFWITSHEEMFHRLKVIFAYLGDMGLSKKRSAGYGHFEFVGVEDINSERLEKGMILSKYIPSSSEAKSFPFKQARYSLTEIKGYTKSGKSFGIIRALKEGATFPSKITPEGRVVSIEGEKYTIVGIPAVMGA